MNYCTLTIAAFAAATFAAFAEAEAADFQIGAYCLKENARTEQHIKDIRDCHVDFVYGIECTDRKTLDLFAKYGLKAIVHGVYRNWWGGVKELNGKMAETIPPQVVEQGVATMKATGADMHPASSVSSRRTTATRWWSAL